MWPQLYFAMRTYVLTTVELLQETILAKGMQALGDSVGFSKIAFADAAHEVLV